MRQKLIEADLIECVLGLGPNLFFNSPMEACVLFCRSTKPAARKGRILFIDGVNEISRERAYSFLKPEHQERIRAAFQAFADAPGFARVATLDEVAAQAHSLSIPLYVKRAAMEAEAGRDERSLAEVWSSWEQQGRAFWPQMDALVDTLDGLVDGELPHV